MKALAFPELARLITDPASYGVPAKLHAGLAWLRANDPVSWIAAEGFDPFWVVTRAADILEVERSGNIFSNGARSTVLVSSQVDAVIRALTGGSPHLVRSLVNMDGDEHKTYRSLTQAWFMPGSIKKLEGRIRDIARLHIDRMIARGGSCDFVRDVAMHFPLHVVMEILGVPKADASRMLVLTQQLFGARDPDLTRSSIGTPAPSAEVSMFQAVIADFDQYFRTLTEQRRAEPRDDIATVIANARINGSPMSDHEALSYYILIATAGHDTTSASASGAIWALAERPQLLKQLQADPSLISNLVDEAIRWVTPVKHFMRSALVDCELGGRAIAAGDWVMLSYMSGNRDEATFEDSFAFRLDRPANKHVAFGHGPHQCIGQHLAKLEMRVLFEELLPRLGELALAGVPTWTQASFVSGPKNLPIAFTPA